MRNTFAVALLATLWLVSTQVRAQDADTIADVRCAIVGVLLVQKADQSQQAAGQMLSMYYIGRIDARAPKLDLEDLIVKEGSRMTNEDFAAEAKRCGAALAARGQALTQMGKNIVERAKKDAAEQAK